MTQPGQPAVGHEGHAAGNAVTLAAGPHAGMNHDAHAGQGESMVGDMLRRFAVSLILTLPIVLYSPIGALVGFTAPPPFGLSMAWFDLILSTPVVWWGGWPFISAAWPFRMSCRTSAQCVEYTGYSQHGLRKTLCR